MSRLFAPTLQEQIACVEREIRMRKQVYPRRVAIGKMRQELAEDEIAAMEAVLDTLRAVLSGRRPE